MIKSEWLEDGCLYNCYVNDIVTGWIEELLWLNGEWLNPITMTATPCIVDYAIHKINK